MGCQGNRQGLVSLQRKYLLRRHLLPRNMTRTTPRHIVVITGALLLLFAIWAVAVVMFPRFDGYKPGSLNTEPQTQERTSPPDYKDGSSWPGASAASDTQPVVGRPSAPGANSDSSGSGRANQPNPLSGGKGSSGNGHREGRPAEPTSPNTTNDIVEDRPLHIKLPPEFPIDLLRIVRRAAKWSTGLPCVQGSRLDTGEYLAFRPRSLDDLVYLALPELNAVRTIDLANIATLAKEQLHKVVCLPGPTWRLDLPAQFVGIAADLILLARMGELEALTLLFDPDFRQVINDSVLSSILGLPALTDLAVAVDSKVVSPATFVQAASGSKLTTLDFLADPFREDWLHALGTLTTLEQLSLRAYQGAWFEGRSVASSLKTLGNLKSLTFLSITSFPSLLLHVNAFPKLDRLKELHLDALVYCMADISLCAELQTVRLGPEGHVGTDWTDSRTAVAWGNRPSTFALIAKLPNLRTLKIRTFWDPDNADLSALALLRQLEEISLGGEGSVKGVLVQIRGCNHLKRVCLEGGDLPAEVLEHLVNLRALEELRLSKCSTIHGGSYARVITSIPNLRKLVLEECSPGDEVALLTAALARSPQLSVQVE